MKTALVACATRHLVDAMMEQVFTDTGWHPQRSKAVAGALSFSKYNPVMRFVMKRITKVQGWDTDTSQDWEYTDWRALDRFIDGLQADVSPRLVNVR